MKLGYRDIEPFVRKPNPKARVILIYGPEEGMMSERSRIIAKTVVADINDPFNAVTLSGGQIAEDQARLADEASAQSLMGGARLIRITECTDKVTVTVKEYLTNPSADNLVILEAGELGPRSSLRLLIEKAQNAAAIPCYVEDSRALSGYIQSVLQEHDKKAAFDAVSWLSDNLVGDRQRVRREIEKLVIYKGNEDGPITLEDAQNSCGAAGAKTIDDLVYAVAGGQHAKAMSIYQSLLDEGIAVIAILRAIQNHFRRLHQAHAMVKDGKSQEQALKSLSPPVFFKLEKDFKQHMAQWSPVTILGVLERLAETEVKTKQTGFPVETLCGQAFLSICHQGRRRGR